MQGGIDAGRCSGDSVWRKPGAAGIIGYGNLPAMGMLIAGVDGHGCSSDNLFVLGSGQGDFVVVVIDG